MPNSRPISREEVVNVLRGWNNLLSQFGRGHERNVRILLVAAEMLEKDTSLIENLENRLINNNEVIP